MSPITFTNKCKSSCCLFGVLLLLLFGAACAPKGAKKSQRFYEKNQASIVKAFQLYGQLYKTQPLSLGFQDRNFKYQAIEIKTDTVRYVLNNEQASYIFPMAIEGFRYDTGQLRALYDTLKSMRCFWMGADKAYGKDRSYNVYFLSFGSVQGGNPFLDREYYNLVWIDPQFFKDNPGMNLERKGFSRIKDNVFYTISDHYR